MKLTLGRVAGLGARQVAYLRAVAEGVDVATAARRYLDVQHGASIAAEHRKLVDQARAIARRNGDPRWRLIGLEIQELPPATEPAVAIPTIDDWAESEGLSDWSSDEQLLLYTQRFGAAQSGTGNLSQKRRQARNARLREHQLDLLRDLEAAAGAAARPTDLLDGWLPADIAEQLRQVGDLTLADLRRRIGRGGRWWTVLRAYGPKKAANLANLVEAICGRAVPAPGWPVAVAQSDLRRLSGAAGRNRYRGLGELDVDDDAAAVERWISARAASLHTSEQYRREAERFMLFCVLERGRALSDVDEADCRAYMEFLRAIPDRWISRRKVPRMTLGWAPFKGQLKIDSQALAITIVAALMGWLARARYLASDPWTLVNRRLGDDPEADDDVTSRAFTPGAWAVVIAAIERAPSSPGVERIRWLCQFGEAVGPRAAELLSARRRHMRRQRGGWIIRVHGKGQRNRTVPVPSTAIAATRRYFASRGLDFDSAPPDTPLLASLVDGAPITYSALNETFTRFVRRAITNSNLPDDEKAIAMRASAHWLRHTYGTRSAERGVPADITQANLGQRDPRTTAHYYRAQLERRQRAMETAFGEGRTIPSDFAEE